MEVLSEGRWDYRPHTVFEELGGPRIGANEVRVPSHLFKLVYDKEAGRAWAHWQANRDDEVVSKPISYKELVRRTDVEWLPGVRLAP